MSIISGGDIEDDEYERESLGTNTARVLPEGWKEARRNKRKEAKKARRKNRGK